jgi:hypothetical protein
VQNASVVQVFIPFMCLAADRNLPPEEMEALQDLYTATDGDYWECYGNPWIFSPEANPCEDEWVGIQCDYISPSIYYHVATLQLNGCFLVGTIPASISWLRNITSLSLSGNHLHGRIPNIFGEMLYLSFIGLDQNSLTGPIPSTLALLQNIQQIHLSDNHLSGGLDGAFDPLVQTKLGVITLANNAFNGQLPDALFQNPALEGLDIHFNCFSGTLPEAICSATGLQILLLNCLSCSNQCTTRLVKRSSYILKNPVHGTVPSCIFSMPQLYNIYLSQNYLSGALPANLQLGPHLYEVSLKSNRLTGSVPVDFLPAPNRSVSLDLRGNRLVGTVPQLRDGNYQDDGSAVYIGYNRISGPVYANDWPFGVNFDVLTGNILGCNNGDRSRLPQNDAAFHSYACGSDNFNKPILAWVGVTVGLLSTMWCVWHCRGRLNDHLSIDQLFEHVALWRAVVTGKHVKLNLPSLVRVREVAFVLNNVAVVVAMWAVCVLGPVYAGLTVSYGTYEHQYAWTLSAVLLSGKVPYAVCFVALLLSIGVGTGALFRGHSHLAAPAQESEPRIHASHSRIIAASILYLTVNFGVVGAVSFSFVATSIYTSAVYQLGISAFKVGWNLCVAPYLSRWLAYELSAARADWFTLELFVSITNNIGIPLLAVVIVSPQCLYNLFGVELTYAMGMGHIFGEIDYDQPFYYNYQCSYIYMDFYAAAFVYASLMASFGMPLLEQLLLQLHGRCTRGTVLFRCVDAVLPRILKPVETDPERIPDRSVLRPFFDTTQFLVAQLTSLALILTMGVVFPPLAVPVAATMVLSALYQGLKVGRLLTNASDEKQHKYLEIIELECANVATPTTMRRAFWLLLWFGCWFYTLFLFDTLGDAVGFYAAYWVLIVVPLLPLVAVVVYLVHEYWGVARTLAAYIAHRLWPHAHTVREAHKDGSVTSVQASGVEVEMVQSPVWAP